VQLDPKITINGILDFCQLTQQLNTFVTQSECKYDKYEDVTMCFNKTKPKVHNSLPRKCSKCGTSHAFRNCPAFNKICNKCGIKNHYASCCKTKSNKHNRTFTKYKKGSSSHNISIFTINSNSDDSVTYLVEMMGKKLNFQLDTGAAVSVISYNQWLELGSPKLEPTLVCPTNFDGSKIETIGEIKLSFKLKNKQVIGKFLVVRSNKNFGLIGRNIIDIDNSLLEVHKIDTDYLPVIKNYKASINLTDKDKSLKFCRARQVPIHLKKDIDYELDCLEKQGIISPISSSSHASPLVWVRKPNGRFRMCVDYKGTLNKYIESDAYPLPTTENIFSRI